MLLAMAIAAALPNVTDQRQRVDCPNAGGVQEAKFVSPAVPRLAPRNLDELPPANLVLSVYREVDRCPAPVVVRYGIGSGSGSGSGSRH